MQITAVSAASAAPPPASGACHSSASQPVGSQPVGSQATDSPPASAATAVRLLNPQPVINPALGIVVTEYFNHDGQLTGQYPSARAIESYQLFGMHPETGKS